MKITFPEGHCLDNHSESTKAQLVDVLDRCLQRDPRRRPTLDALLAHPFLSSAAQVKREAHQVAVASVMDRVVRLLGESLQAPECASAPAPDEWQILADEVWQQISAKNGGGEAPDLQGLAPLMAFTSQVKKIRQERDAAIAEKRRLEEQLRVHTFRHVRDAQPRGQQHSGDEQHHSSFLKQAWRRDGVLEQN